MNNVNSEKGRMEGSSHAHFKGLYQHLLQGIGEKERERTTANHDKTKDSVQKEIRWL